MTALGVGPPVLSGLRSPALAADARSGHPAAILDRWLFLLAIVLVSCDPNQHSAGLADAGDRILRWELGEAPAWEVEERFRFGAADDPVRVLTRVREVFIGPEGHLFVSQPSDYTIRVLDPDGVHARMIGRRGTGPGEFMGPMRVGLLGDSILYVGDGDLHRLTAFSLDGEVLYTVPEWATPPIREPPVNYLSSPPERLLADGSALVRPLYGFPASAVTAEGFVARTLYLRIRPGSAAADTVAWTEVRTGQTAPAVHSRGERFSLHPPFDHGPLGELTADGSGVTLVERDPEDAPDQTWFRVTRIGPAGDTAFSHVFQERPVPLTRAEIDDIVATEVDRISSVAAEMGGRPPSARTIRRTMAAAGWLRRTYVTVTALATDQEGRIWLRREDVPSSETVVWTVLDGLGEKAGRVRLPSSQRFLAARGEMVVALDVDEWGVPTVVGYRLVRP